MYAYMGKLQAPDDCLKFYILGIGRFGVEGYFWVGLDWSF